MSTHPYSIYIDKRSIRIAFLVSPSPDSIEKVDQIIDYNRSLWGGRYNPIILTDGNTIEDRWWKFLRDVDPDIIKPLVPLATGIVEKFETFLSPLMIEEFRENEQSNLRISLNPRIAPANISIDSSDIHKDLILFGNPILGTFNVDEMDDDIGKLFVHRNFGISTSTRWAGGWDAFDIPILLEAALARGEVPPEVHEGFKRKGIPFPKEVFSKKSTQHPEKWAIIDKENNLIHYVERENGKLRVRPYKQNTDQDPNELEKKIHLVTDRSDLAGALLELARTENIVYRDQICAFPNTEREPDNAPQSPFEVIVGDTLQDIVHFWNRPWLLSRWKRKYMNQVWLPTALATDLATDLAMEDALCSWVSKNAWLGSGDLKTVHFSSLSSEKRELKHIVDRFETKLRGSVSVKHYTDPQTPSLADENPLFFRDSIETRRAQSNQDIFELTEPNGLNQHDTNGHWMADFSIEFTHDADKNQDDVIRWRHRNPGFWKFPNRNHLTFKMFDRLSRIRQNGFPAALMKRGEKVLRFTRENPESVVASLFFSDNRLVYEESDPRFQVATTPYHRSDISDKGKYLQGVLELFGGLTFAYEVLRNPYWRAMFDSLSSKNTRAESHAEKSVTDKLRKLIKRSDPLTSQAPIESLAKQIVNLATTLALKQKEASFKDFIAEAERQKEKNIDNDLLTSDQYGVDLLFQLFDSPEVLAFANKQHEMDMVDFGFRSEDVKDALSQLIQRNIIQIGVRPQCPRCGTTNWYHVDDTSQQLTCQGCRFLFSLDPELKWQYKLNSLIHSAHASHGTTPVILVLGQLLEESKTCFVFSPNLNLYDESLKKAEVDIACIQDGKFIIGEVKQSMSLFRPKDFDDMAEIAEKTKPDILLFSCIDSQQPTRNITKHIERIQSKLSPFETEVMWYELKSLDYSYGV